MKTTILALFLTAAAAADAQPLTWPTITANGPTEAQTFRDGTGELYVAGSLDGATVSLQSALVDDPTLPEDEEDPDANLAWFPVQNCGNVTAPGTCIFTVGESRLRLDVTGGGAGLEINAGTSRVRVAHHQYQGSGGGSPSWTDDGSLAFGFAPDDLVSPLLTLEDEEIRFPSFAGGIGSGGTPTLTQPHFRWPMPTIASNSYLWVEDSFGTWSGLNIKVHTHRWTFERTGPFKSENNIGIVNQKGADTASFRTHTSFNVGMGGDGLLGSGSLVATDSSLTWDVSRVSITDLLRLPVRSTPPASPLCGDLYFDAELLLPCLFDCTNFVQMDDFSTVCT